MYVECVTAVSSSRIKYFEFQKGNKGLLIFKKFQLLFSVDIDILQFLIVFFFF